MFSAMRCTGIDPRRQSDCEKRKNLENFKYSKTVPAAVTKTMIKQNKFNKFRNAYQCKPVHRESKF